VSLFYVRPGPAALAWLADTVRELQDGDPLRLVTVLVPNEFAGRHARWALAEAGYANVGTMRLTAAALEVARPARPASARLLDPVLEEGAARATVRAQPAFGAIDHPSLHGALLDLFRALRRAERDPAAPAPTGASEVTRAALDAYRAFTERTAPYDDLTGLTTRAAERLADGAEAPPELTRLGALVLFLPTSFYAAEARFLAAAARWVPLRAAFAHVGDPTGVGDAPGRRAAALLAEAEFRRVEERGLTGHPFAWENARAAVLADLRALLRADQAWRLEQRLAPARFEQASAPGARTPGRRSRSRPTVRRCASAASSTGSTSTRSRAARSCSTTRPAAARSTRTSARTRSWPVSTCSWRSTAARCGRTWARTTRSAAPTGASPAGAGSSTTASPPTAPASTRGSTGRST
jgi:hypothetical protein